MDMIRVRSLVKAFPGGPRAVDHLDLTVREGEILGLLGPNGAGKTTTIRVLSTLSGFDEGEVWVAGHNVDREPEQVRRAIGVVAQQTGIDYFLTGRENLELQGHLYRMRRREIRARIEELAHYFALEKVLDQQVMTYSGGMRRKLDIATALIHRPRLVFLDEPTLGLDIKSRKALWTYIAKLNQEAGLTILLTTHYLEEADKLAHRVAIINAGRIRVVGPPEELKSRIAGDAITLTFPERDSAAEGLFQALQQTGLIQDSFWEGSRLHLYVANGAECVPRFTALAAEHGVQLQSLALARPTLDDVFLKYTGTTMEGAEGEEEEEAWWKQWAGKGGGKWAKQWQKWQEQQEEGEETASGGPRSGPWTAEEMAQWWQQQQQQAQQQATATPEGQARPSTAEQAGERQGDQAQDAAQQGAQGPWTPEEMAQWWQQQQKAQQQATAEGREAGGEGGKRD